MNGREHPLRPLSADEIASAVAIVGRSAEFRQLSESARFVEIALSEPSKQAILSGEDHISREATVIILDRAKRGGFQALVSIGAGTVKSWVALGTLQPAALVDELDEAGLVIARDERFRHAVTKRGLDPDKVQVDPWPAGNFGSPDEQRRRLARAIAYVKARPEDNAYAHPIEGLLVLIDLHEMKVLNVEDYGITPVPPMAGNFGEEPKGGFRTDLKTIVISQPDGPSFDVKGYGVRWQNWHFRIGFTPREGLVLHLIAYEDGSALRPIIYRASLSEMVVPYGDPSPTQFFKNAFDAGENGVGMAANAQRLGCDCLGEIRYFDVILADTHGRPRTVKNAICMHEEDDGILWRHVDWRTNRGHLRRSRRLVVSSWSSIGNYDYGFFWYFRQDGSIEYEVKLTGVLSTGAVGPEERPQHGALIAPQLNGVVHQHYFNVRLDMHVDGEVNSVWEIDAEGTPAGAENPLGNAFQARRTLLRTGNDGRRIVDPLAARHWLVTNPSAPNSLGEPVGYRIVPAGNVLPFAREDSSLIRRAGFITKHLWITPYSPTERYAAGDFPNQHPGGDGLPSWQDGKQVDQRDIVVWYTFGHHHLPRPEDWPVMPVARTGFRLEPVGFFDANPALDVPPPDFGEHHHRHHEGSH